MNGFVGSTNYPNSTFSCHSSVRLSLSNDICASRIWPTLKILTTSSNITWTLEIPVAFSRQSAVGGNTPTAIQQRTKNARSSIYNATTGPTKGNNPSAPSFNGKSKTY